MALVIAVIGSGILLAIVRATGANVKADSPGVTIGATLIQDGVLVGCALWLAARVAPPRPWQFGLRGTPFWRGLKWAAIAFGIYITFQLIYAAAVHPNEKQTTLQDLGAGTSPIVTFVIGVLVVGVAPVAEEFFFRGFFYGALRTRFSFASAALIDGVVFGAVHPGRAAADRARHRVLHRLRGDRVDHPLRDPSCAQQHGRVRGRQAGELARCRRSGGRRDRRMHSRTRTHGRGGASRSWLSGYARLVWAMCRRFVA
jgi:membrane protease YdiL (CAAX protease family)